MKKPLKIVLASLGAVLLVAGTVAFIAVPTTYNINKSYIKENNDYNVTLVKDTKYTTLAKVDKNGNYLDDDFKVIGFTDMHLDTYKECGNYTINFMIQNIVNEKPDLVVLLGDCITSAVNKRRARQLANTFEKLGVYWTYTLGNHEGDNTFSMSRKNMMKLFDSYKHCLVDSSLKYVDNTKVDGNNNYVVNVLGSDKSIRQSLYFIDSHDEMSDEDLIKYDSEFTNKKCEDYDYIKESQIKWYENTVKDINSLSSKNVKSTMFIHIPLKEFKYGYQDITGEPDDDTVNPSATFTYPLENNGNVLLYGKRRENICCSGHNSGMFAKIKELNSTQAVFAGHDHVNDFVIKYQGVILGYNQPSGYSSYNVVSKKLEDKLIKGYSVYTYDKDGNITTQSKINADIYPEVQSEVLKVVRH